MESEVRRTVTLTLEQGEALDALEYLVRSYRLTDGARSCPLPLRACETGRELLDTLGAALGLGTIQDQEARFPRTALEEWAQDLRWGQGHLRGTQEEEVGHRAG